jgi:hypothetical protein
MDPRGGLTRSALRPRQASLWLCRRPGSRRTGVAIAWRRFRRDGAAPGACPSRWLGHLRPPLASGAGQRGRLHRSPGTRAERDTGTVASHRYLLAGLLRCGICRRRLESFWANNRPGYRCRHGHSSATTPDPTRPKNLYVREDHILPHLAGLHVRLTGREFPAERRRRRTRRGAEVSRKVNQEDAIGYLRARQITLTYDAQTRTLQADTPEAVTTVVTGRAS